MAAVTMAKALNDGPARGAGGRPQGPRHGRGRRQARRRVPGHRRAAEGLRRGPGASTPRWPSRASSARRSGWRCAATGRCARSSSTASSSRPYDQISQPAGQDALPLAGAAADAGRRPHPVRRRHRRGRAPQRVARGAVRAHRGPEGRGLLQPGRRLLDDPAGDRRRRPGDLLRAEAALLGEGRGRRVGAAAAAAARGAAWCARAPTSRCCATGRWCKTCLRGRGRRRGGRARSLEVIDLRSLVAARPAGHLRLGAQDRPARGGARGAARRVGLGAEIAARITEECFYSLEAPVLRVAGLRHALPAGPLEEDYLPDLDRVLDAVDRALAY